MLHVTLHHYCIWSCLEDNTSSSISEYLNWVLISHAHLPLPPMMLCSTSILLFKFSFHDYFLIFQCFKSDCACMRKCQLGIQLIGIFHSRGIHTFYCMTFQDCFEFTSSISHCSGLCESRLCLNELLQRCVQKNIVEQIVSLSTLNL